MSSTLLKCKMQPIKSNKLIWIEFTAFNKYGNRTEWDPLKSVIIHHQ